MITTLSTKAGYLGEEIRDGFQLAIDQENGKLGGIPVELLVDDDGRKPEKAKQIAERFIKRDGAKILGLSGFPKRFNDPKAKDQQKIIGNLLKGLSRCQFVRQRA
jgi:branched-chain amino acid transport system substrate-binding protein